MTTSTAPGVPGMPGVPSGAPAAPDTAMARARAADSDQLRLYRLYRTVPTAEEYAETLALEERWIGPMAARFEAGAPDLPDRAALLAALRGRLAAEAAAEDEAARFVAEEAGLEQLKVVAAEFAVDGLTESETLLPVVARLAFPSGLAVFRVLIDELGCGSEEKAHSRLYRDLLTGLGMTLDLEHYVQRAAPESLAYVNLFHWLASRAPEPEYFLGGYAYFESSVLYAFQCYRQAAERLGLSEHAYYTEHLYIDGYHSRQMRAALKALDTERGLDTAKVWAGVELTGAVAGAAFEAAVERARAAGAPS
ncbi:iron-containing redox enzyme family protein [Nocardiopsis chromatogenes]|uniref:iron-containing redox enzyme family protein n=1 Tax=Nocardiopsis chromatogenes TaxID=280239 RepID=UPI00034B0C6A|nr:iron-containing redox enzyme family protein [Nocardiopsis chromatogenes]